MMAGDLYSKA